MGGGPNPKQPRNERQQRIQEDQEADFRRSRHTYVNADVDDLDGLDDGEDEGFLYDED